MKKSNGDDFMWGINGNLEIQNVVQITPYLSYLALENKTRKIDGKENINEPDEGTEFSKEIKRLNPVVEQITENLDQKEEEEEKREKQEEKEEIDNELSESIKSAWKEAFMSNLKKST